MREKNWGIILGTLGAMVIFAVATLAGVSEETAFVRAILGGAVGAFVGFGFNFLANSADSPPLKGQKLDVTLPKEQAGGELARKAADAFQPLDFTQMTQVVKSQIPGGTDGASD